MSPGSSALAGEVLSGPRPQASPEALRGRDPALLDRGHRAAGGERRAQRPGGGVGALLAQRLRELAVELLADLAAGLQRGAAALGQRDAMDAAVPRVARAGDVPELLELPRGLANRL